jgi:tetratricopeptide (TPR) repeat protein
MPLWGESAGYLARHHFETGAKLQGGGEIEGAIRHYTRVLDEDSQYPNLHLYRGWAYYQAGNYSLAFADLDRALDLDPTQGQVFQTRAWVRLRAGHIASALEDASRLVAANPDEPKGHALRGWIRAQAGDPEGGLDECSFSIEIDPRFVEGYVYRAFIHLRRGAMREAAEDAGRVLTLDRKNASGAELLGRLSLLDSQWAQARENFERAPRAASPGAWCRYGIAMTHRVARRWEEAREELDRAYPLAWGDPSLRDHVQLDLWGLGHRQGDAKEADERLGEYLRSRHPCPSESWTGKIAEFLLERLSEANFRSAAAAAHPGVRQERECQLEYYVGLRRQLSGDAAGARQAFQACVDGNRRDYYEWVLARAELSG